MISSRDALKMILFLSDMARGYAEGLSRFHEIDLQDANFLTFAGTYLPRQGLRFSTRDFHHPNFLRLFWMTSTSGTTRTMPTRHEVD